MYKKLSYYLVCISVLIIQTHNVVIHHHDLPDAGQDFLHHDEESHNVFSSVDIDEEFILHNKINTSVFFIAVIFSKLPLLNLPEATSNKVFITKNEYPPPKPFCIIKSLRAPPVNFIC